MTARQLRDILRGPIVNGEAVPVPDDAEVMVVAMTQTPVTDELKPEIVRCVAIEHTPETNEVILWAEGWQDN